VDPELLAGHELVTNPVEKVQLTEFTPTDLRDDRFCECCDLVQNAETLGF